MIEFSTLKQAGRFLIILGIQILILNQIHLGGYITPFFYPLFILLLPFQTKGYVVLLLAFFTGLAVDMFSNSLGMHAAATLFMAFFRPGIIRLLSIKTEFEPEVEPRIHVMGKVWVLTYTVILLLIHHLSLFLIEVFRFDELAEILAKTVISTGFSVIIIMLAHFLMGSARKT